MAKDRHVEQPYVKVPTPSGANIGLTSVMPKIQAYIGISQAFEPLYRLSDENRARQIAKTSHLLRIVADE